MAVFEKDVTVDLSAENSYNCVSVKQGDFKSRFLKVTILADGTRFVIPDEDIVSLRCLHEDGTFDISFGTVNEDNTVSFEIPKKILSSFGTVSCDLSIVRGSDSTLSSSVITLIVNKSALGEKIDTDDGIKTPSELFAMISETIVKSHEHTNSDILDKFSEDDDGNPLYDGKKIASDDASGDISAENISYSNESMPDVTNVKEALDKNGHSHENKDTLDKFGINTAKTRPTFNNGSTNEVLATQGDVTSRVNELQKYVPNAATVDGSTLKMQRKTGTTDVGTDLFDVDLSTLLIKKKSSFYANDWNEGTITNTAYGGTLDFMIAEEYPENRIIFDVSVCFEKDGETAEYSLSKLYVLGMLNATPSINICSKTEFNEDYGFYTVAFLANISNSEFFNKASVGDISIVGFKVYYIEI